MKKRPRLQPDNCWRRELALVRFGDSPEQPTHCATNQRLAKGAETGYRCRDLRGVGEGAV